MTHTYLDTLVFTIYLWTLAVTSNFLKYKLYKECPLAGPDSEIPFFSEHCFVFVSQLVHFKLQFQDKKTIT